MLRIDKMSRTPIYEQVIAQIEAHIRIGEYAPGSALPSVRALSVSLGVNPNTLQKAYGELEREGLTVSVPGSGRFVAEGAADRLRTRARQKKGEFRALAGELLAAGIAREELHAAVDEAAEERGGAV